MSALTPLQQIILSYEDPEAACALVLVLWTAVCDGRYSRQEKNAVRELLAEDAKFADVLVEHVIRLTPEDLAFVCRAFQHECEKTRQLLMQLILGVAIADGRLAVGENFVLRFLADVLDVPIEELFHERTGRPFPVPGDISSRAWWQNREAEEASENNGDPLDANSTPDPECLAALATLGLSAGATSDQLRKAYRRLVAIHHPDRFAQLGQQAQAIAADTFKQIHAAYEYLVAHD